MVAVPVEMSGNEGDHEPRGAEAALACVKIHHCLLHAVWAAVGTNHPLNRSYSLAVQLGQKQDARVDRPVPDLPSDPVGHQYGACAAVPFVAAFLGAGQPVLSPNVIKQGC